VFTPHEIIERLVAIVPRPRAHLTRYFGVLAPAFAARSGIVPTAAAASLPAPRAPPPAEAGGRRRPGRVPWASLIWRVFLNDVLECGRCGGRMGPSWTASDGSIVAARTLAQVDSPRSDAIPWLLLKEFSIDGEAGVFTDIAIVQRLNTAGGKVPSAVCDATIANTMARIPYAADYCFYSDLGSDAGARD
jgi:hypothetical protein